MLVVSRPKPVKMLLVFIHGFRGSDATFNEFPAHLTSSLSTLLPNEQIDIVVYPKFETKGSLTTATETFCMWLKGLETRRRAQSNSQLPLPTILIGHSMGGLLAGDVYLRYCREKELAEPTQFPHLLGILGFDSPFYGLNHTNLTRSAYSKATKLNTEVRRAAREFRLSEALNNTRSSSSNGPSQSRHILSLALGGLATAAGLFMDRDNMSSLYSYAMDHIDFVNALVRPEELNRRVQALVELPDALFYCFYLQIQGSKSRFINLPGENLIPNIGHDRFIAIENAAGDEINGHTSMFNPNINVHYEDMTRQAAVLIFQAITKYQAASATPGQELIAFD
ncbi:hypothetical protein DSO57_1017723 [Entomophthora muscae]|uniref:Uncharacterized protein n=1 Tax=Entomophthora muscae TaxID=34485 RepID=A0ACC2TFG6_9FUNG|nr:hypothetical protein DSO57_1017723 [Entomophthora muscae]